MSERDECLHLKRLIGATVLSMCLLIEHARKSDLADQEWITMSRKFWDLWGKCREMKLIVPDYDFSQNLVYTLPG